MVTIPYDDAGLTPEEEAVIALLHHEDMGGWHEWVDRTVSRDAQANTVTGHVFGLSWFAAALPVGPDLWAVECRWGDPPPGNEVDWPFFEGWMPLGIRSAAVNSGAARGMLSASA